MKRLLKEAWLLTREWLGGRLLHLSLCIMGREGRAALQNDLAPTPEQVAKAMAEYQRRFG